MQTKTPITLTPVGEQEMCRTIADPTLRPAQSHLQDPTGQVICPYCHQETNIDAADLFNVLGQPVSIPGIRYHSPNRRIGVRQWAVCNQCTGPFGVILAANQLHIALLGVPTRVLVGEKALQEKEAARNAQRSRQHPVHRTGGV
jgi:hypothetical protein